MIPMPQPPTALPTLAEVDAHLEALKEQSKVWREFRKAIASREPKPENTKVPTTCTQPTDDED